MPWNGSGVFTRNYSWVNDAANNIPITASRVDADSNDIVSNGLNNCLTRDGQGSPTANLPMNGFKHTGAAAGVANTDYATMAQIAGFAPLASPAFTGVPTAPTAAAGTSTTQLATTAFVSTGYLGLTGGTVSGPLIVSGTFTNSSNTTINGFCEVLGLLNGRSGFSPDPAGNLLVYNAGSNVLGFRTGNANQFFTMDASGNFNCLNGTITAPSGNISAGGIFIAGGVNQPTIFVQSGTPSAHNVGDLWFW